MNRYQIIEDAEARHAAHIKALYELGAVVTPPARKRLEDKVKAEQEVAQKLRNPVPYQERFRNG